MNQNFSFSDAQIHDQELYQKTIHDQKTAAQQEPGLEAIRQGEFLPQLYYDVIAKKIFSPEEHPERGTFLLSRIAQDPEARIVSGAGEEGYLQSLWSKKMLFDIHARLSDGRRAVIEFQKAAQSFIFRRGELYSSDMLLIQYSAQPGQKKSERTFLNTCGVILLVLMVESPRAFREFDRESDRYIHRFDTMTADSGLQYDSLSHIIYVQLDKCLLQFQAGTNAESPDHKPDELQTLLAMIADSNNELVTKGLENYPNLQGIRDELEALAGDEEVQTMISQEQLDRITWFSALEESREEGVEQGHKQGLEQGLQQGLEKGQFLTMASLIRGGVISRTVAAKQLGLSEDRFLKRCGELGLQV